MGIRIIVAMARNGAIGVNNRLPWYIPEDLKHFRDNTMDKTLVMGRKTFESILKYNNGNPLFRRNHIVLSKSDPSKEYLEMEQVLFVRNFRDVLKMSLNQRLYVIGGSNIYAQFAEYADDFLITYIDQTYVADAFFPDIDWKNFNIAIHNNLIKGVDVYYAVRKYRLDKYSHKG
jgi:dihydrofolate reductase